jgi:hypothetical protein
MGCFLGLLSRVGVLCVWVGTSLVNRAFHGGWILPLLGILFLPVTTLVYVAVFAIAGGVAGWAWLWIVLGFLYDVGAHGSVAYNNRRRIRVPKSWSRGAPAANGE